MDFVQDRNNLKKDNIKNLLKNSTSQPNHPNRPTDQTNTIYGVKNLNHMNLFVWHRKILFNLRYISSEKNTPKKCNIKSF